MKVAALDLGSNTSLLLIAEVVDGKIMKVIRDELRVTRMGQGVHQNKAFHPEALERVRSCFKEYAQFIKQEKVEHVVAMATSAARDVTNAEELFKIGNDVGIPIEIIPGSQEADITFRGSTFEEENLKGLAVIDVGGGSTEIIGESPDGKIEGVSVNLGSVRLTEIFVKEHPIAPAAMAEMQKYIDAQIEEAIAQFPKSVREVLAVAGTPTTLAAVIQEKPYSHDVVHGFRISLAQLEYWRNRLAKLTVDERRALSGMDQKRADVIVAGISILASVTKALGANCLRVSDRGVRFGVALVAEERARKSGRKP